MNTLRLLASALLLGSFFSIAKAGTITGTYANYESPVNLRTTDDFAIWGEASLTASDTKGTGLIAYTLGINTPTGSGELGFNGYAGAFGTGSSWIPGGIYWLGNQDRKGYFMTVSGSAMEGRYLDIYVLNNGPVSANVYISSGVSGSVAPWQASLPAYQYHKVTVMASGLTENMTVSLTASGSVLSNAGQMALGAAALVAVDEPGYCLLTVAAVPPTLGLMSRRRKRRESANQVP